jgi:hypothetical protein
MSPGALVRDDGGGDGSFYANFGTWVRLARCGKRS